MTFGSAERVLDAPSPIIRTAVQACMSRAVIRRENCLIKSVLQLHRSPLVVRAVPARWNKPGGSCYGPRIPAPVRQRGRKDLAFVRGHENIVGGTRSLYSDCRTLGTNPRPLA
jgi:hypothetical protein